MDLDRLEAEQAAAAEQQKAPQQSFLDEPTDSTPHQTDDLDLIWGELKALGITDANIEKEISKLTVGKSSEILDDVERGTIALKLADWADKLRQVAEPKGKK